MARRSASVARQTGGLRDLFGDLRTKQIDLLFAQIRGSARDRMK